MSPTMELFELEALVQEVMGARFAITQWPDGTSGAKYPNAGSRSRPVAYIEPRGQNTAQPQVMHFYRKADILLPESYGLPVDKRYFVEQQTFRVREFVMTLRSFVNLLSEHEAPSKIPFETVRAYLSGILEALNVLHKDGLFHGDLRPENVALGDDDTVRLIDYAVRVPLGDLPSDRKGYVAPELRDGARKGSISGDIYSFGQLAVELLRPFRGDHKHPQAARLERQLSWLADYCAVADPQDRPSALSIKRALIDLPPSNDPELNDVILDAYNLIKREGLGKSAPTSRLRLLSRPSSLDRLSADISMFPETGFSLKCQATARRLALWLAVDNSSVAAYEPHLDGIIGLSTMDKATLQTSVDSKWTNAVHRTHYGFGIDKDHALRTKSLILSPADRERDDIYDAHLAGMNAVRKTLLSGNEFFHTHDVAALISTTGLEFRDTEVITLRQWGDILAVPDHDRWLYPAFQFNPATAMVSPLIRYVHDQLRLENGIDEDEWTVLSYWDQPRPSLGGRSFKDALWAPGARKAIKFDLSLRQR